MKKEKVIFRREYDPYRKEWSFLAIFPETEANPGNVAFLPFWFIEHMNYSETVYGVFDEMDIWYMYKCKIVHKNDEIIPRLLSAIESYYDQQFQVVEKIMH